jgi:putative two-component system response regulator
VGRIVAIADVFDALTSVRPYKKAWTEQEAVDFLHEQKGRHFDPQLVDLFADQLPAIREIRLRWAETE